MTLLQKQNLLNELKNSNKQAFNLLFNYYYKILTNHAFEFVLNYEVAKDISQEVFVKLWETRKKLPNVENLESYLFTSTRNAAFDYIRREKNRNEFESYIINRSLELFDGNSKQEFDELSQVIANCLDNLSNTSKEIYHLKMNGKKNQEVSELLNISIKTVEKHSTIYKKALKISLNEYFNN
jgi:RNA polymerase sigma-70 factor (ECF subfamily)